MKKRIFVVLLLAAAFFVNAAQGQFQVSLLDQVASSIAKRQVIVKCKNKKEDEILTYAWGYVRIPVSTAKYTVIDEEACLGALAIDLDIPEFSEYIKVMGVSVLTHEAFHLKKIQGNRNEALTECRAMQNYDHTLMKLGAEENVMARLMPLLVLNHFLFIEKNPVYYLSSCKIPARYDKWLTES